MMCYGAGKLLRESVQVSLITSLYVPARPPGVRLSRSIHNEFCRGTDKRAATDGGHSNWSAITAIALDSLELWRPRPRPPQTANHNRPRSHQYFLGSRYPETR
jgi:hypothetical protein